LFRDVVIYTAAVRMKTLLYLSPSQENSWHLKLAVHECVEVSKHSMRRLLVGLHLVQSLLHRPEPIAIGLALHAVRSLEFSLLHDARHFLDVPVHHEQSC
jgi:hypothetical protein